MKILITGARGYLGRELTAIARKMGHYVLEMDLPGGDILEPDRIRAVTKGHRIDVIFHLAAKVEVGKSGEDYWTTNVQGTINVLDSAVHIGTEKVVMASSLSVKGMKGIPESTYGWTKALAEDVAERYADHRGLDITALRIANIAGNRHSSKTHLIPNLIRAVRGEKPLEIHGGALDIVRDFVHVEDVAMAFLHFGVKDLNGSKSSFRTIEIGRGVALKVRDVIEKAAKIWKWNPVLDPKVGRPGDLDISVADPGIAMSHGWTPRRGLKEILISAKQGRKTWDGN